MTIAQEFVEIGKAMGLDTSDCKTGNIVETLNAMTIKNGGEVTDSNLISTAMMNFRNSVYGNGESEFKVSEESDKNNNVDSTDEDLKENPEDE